MFTTESPQLIAQSQRDAGSARKVLLMLCASSEIQLPNKLSSKMKLSDLMDTMVQRPKNLYQQCFEAIAEMYLQMDCSFIVTLLLDHLAEHQCVNVSTLLLRLLPRLKNIIIDDGYHSEIIQRFEQVISTNNGAYMRMCKQQHEGDFHFNLTKFLLLHYPQVYSKEIISKERSSLNDKSQSIVQVYKVPPLKLPTATLEHVVTRSTRRADPFKSFSTTSNRFSIDQRATEGNQSLDTPKLRSAKETLADLATQMGSYCLSQDLPSLISKQRKQQLESLAKLGLSMTAPPIEETDSVDVEICRVTKNRLARVWANIVLQLGRSVDNNYTLNPCNSIISYLLSKSIGNKVYSNKRIPYEFDCEWFLQRNSLLIDRQRNENQNAQEPEQSVYFMIVDLYNSEKSHLRMSQNMFKDSTECEESERSIESPSAVVNIPELMLPIRTPQAEIVSNYRLARFHQNLFLTQLRSRILCLMNSGDMSKTAFYEQEIECLKVLDGYLCYTQSRIRFQEFLEHFGEVILMVKRQIIDFATCQNARTPHSSQYQSKSTKHYSQTINNMFKQMESPSARQPFIKKHPHIISLLLSIIARLQLLATNGESIKYMLQLWQNDHFMDVIKQFATWVLQDISSRDESLELHALRVLFFYESGLVMLQTRHDKEHKAYLRKQLINTQPILKLLTKFVENHNYHKMTRIQVYRKAFHLVGVFFSFDNHRTEEIASFFIRYCYVNFIKLYSQSNLNDLRALSEGKKQDDKMRQHHTHNLNLFITCLFQIATNRTEEISRKFYQYKIVEFLTREIDLEFDVTQIRQESATPRSEIPENTSFVEDTSERAAQAKEVPKLHLNLNFLHKQPLDTVEEEVPDKKSKVSQNLLKKVLIPKLDIEHKVLQKEVVSQSYSHSPQFVNAKLNNLTQLFKSQQQQQQELDHHQQQHKRGNSLKIDIQLSESQRMLLQKNLSEKKQVPKLNLNGTISEDIFYTSERRLRKIYQDEDLHANCLGLLISLLIKRDSLDDVYCSQHPIINGKPNILFLLHHHFNHPSNAKILPLLQSRLSHLKWFPVGQRLLKLLCVQLFDSTQYTDWQKISSGAYGVIYECKTSLNEPEIVAVKQMSVPKSIYERCVLHGLFTEISCLEQMRLSPSVAKLYDYGVTGTDYMMVMKRYPISLKDWRLQQKGGFQEGLATYLAIYRDVLQAVQTLHNLNISHYDIKADNILLEFGHGTSISVVITDFGESKLFANEEDEYCVRNRGTEYIKSPEMLTLTINSKKEQDNYDRRKKVGTTRSSDIWSLGCLLFEILTGELLFYHKEWVTFYLQVTQAPELIPPEKAKLLNNNVYLLDFLKYVLVRDQKHRPNTESILKRFEHVHALIVNNTASSASNYLNQQIPILKPINELLEDYHKIVYHKEKRPPKSTLTVQPLMAITNEIFIGTKQYYSANIDRLVTLGITNILSDTSIIRPPEITKFQYLLFSIENINIANYIKAAQLLPHMLDYIKQLLLHRGKLLIIETHATYLRQALVLSLCYFIKLPIYETLAIFNSQTLFLQIDNLPQLSQIAQMQQQVHLQTSTYPKLQCICGCSTLLLKREYNDEKKIQQVSCKCHGMCNGGASQTRGCSYYLKFLRKRYRLCWDSIRWGVVELENYLMSPFNAKQETKIQLLLSSMGNSNLVTLQNSDWRVYQCRVCHMWMLAHNRLTGETLTVMNNLLRKTKSGFTDRTRIPTLKNFNLYDLK